MSSSYSIQHIGIIGLSHLGVIWSVGYASLGFDVIGFDIDINVINILKHGILTVPEPGLPELFQASKAHLKFTNSPGDLEKCDVLFFARDVPIDEEGCIDLTEIDRLLEVSIPHLSQNVRFVFMGQVPVGYTRKLETKIKKLRPDLQFYLVYRVETLTIGQAVNDFLKPDRIIVGLSDSSQNLDGKLQKVLQEPFYCPISLGSYESAELTKSAINIYLANAVTFVNTISDLCERVGANIHEIVAAMKLDKRFSPYCYWRPGLGFAGGHLERDLISLSKLSEENDIDPIFFQNIIQNSKNRYRWLVDKLERFVFENNSKPTLCLWGLAYKKGTDSLHNAHCLKIICDFSSRASIQAYDPVATLPSGIKGVKTFSDKFEALKQSDAVLILTEWDEFKIDDPKPFRELMHNPVVIDCVQVLGPKVLKDSRIQSIVMGVPYGKRP